MPAGRHGRVGGENSDPGGGLLPVVGQPASLQKLLENDPCFGKHYAKTNDTCKRCRMPVVKDGQLVLMKEACRAETEGTTVGPLKRLTSQDVLDRLSRGDEPFTIWVEILAGKDPTTSYGSEARNLLASRLRYLQNEYELDVPELPYTKVLRKRFHREKADGASV